MIDKKFINNLSATNADVRILDVKKINLKGKSMSGDGVQPEMPIQNTEITWLTTQTPKVKTNELEATLINLDGKDIRDVCGGLKLPDDYPKLVTRYNITSDTYYVLYNDLGEMVYMGFADKITNSDNSLNGLFMNYTFDIFENNFLLLENGVQFFLGSTIKEFHGDMPNLKTGALMFRNCSKLTRFVGNLDSLQNGVQMFERCYNVISFESELPSLQDGRNMFSMSLLDEASLERILNSIPTYTSGTHELCLGIIDDDNAGIVEQITGVDPLDSYEVSYKGWTLIFE